MFQELHFAFRRLRQSPGFALVAILTLALGIGFTTAVFTIVDSVLLQPLAYRESGRLVVAWERVKFLGAGYPYSGPNPRHAEIWRQRASAFSSFALFRHGATGLARGNEHPRLTGVLIAQPALLSTLGVHPILGRDLRPEDAVKGRDQVVLLSHALWGSLFAFDSAVVGKTIRLSDKPLTVIGVLPAGFVLPPDMGPTSVRAKIPAAQVLVPAVIDPAHFGWNGDYGNWTAVARLRPGISLAQAQVQLDSLQQAIVREMPADQRDDAPNALLSYVQPLQEGVVGDARIGLWFLLAAVGGLMLIACVNLANTQLGRAISREREAAVRSALGASRKQLLASSLSESLLLASAGGLAGLVLATAILDAFRAWNAVDLPRMSEIHLSVPVFVFAAVLTLSCTLLFGAAPALKLLAVDPQTALQQNSSRTQQGSRVSRRARYWLVGIQVFACTALLLVTGLLTTSLWRILSIDKGFSPAQVTAAQVELQNVGYSDDSVRSAFDDAVLNRLRALPGVDSAALLSAMPLEGETWLDSMNVPGNNARISPLANWRWVSPGYFETIREPLVAGRTFEDRDRNLHSVILSQSAARAAFGKESAIGKQIRHNYRLYSVIGEVADARNNSLKQAPVNMVYLHYADNPPYRSVFLVRSTLPQAQTDALMREALYQQDPAVTIARIKSLDAQVNDSLASERFRTTLLIAFGGAALLLAMLGIYGVLSYSVADRRREIGVRMALGANRRSIYSLTVTAAAGPVLIGLGAGYAASLAGARYIQSLLFGVKVSDPLVTVGVAVLFVAAAIIAAYLPARRAASIEPMEALRSD